MHRPGVNSEFPAFSIVIPCFNEERHVGGLLSDLSQQTETPYRVVVSDSASEDKTLEVATQFTDRLPLEIVHHAGRSPAAARNKGAEALNHCRPHDYLVFIDADMRLPVDFLERIRGETTEHPADFVTPKFLSDGQHILDTLCVWGINVQNKHTIARRHRVAGIGGVMIVRKTFHDRVGGFPEDVVIDDAAYAERLNNAGATAHYAETAHAINSSRRLREEGVWKWMLGLAGDNSLVARALNRFSTKGYWRPYGHYKQKP